MTLYARSGEDIDRGLIGFWKLDDKKNGSSVAIDRAKFNDGTITGATNTTGINGLNADAMFFDGVDDRVSQSAISEVSKTKPFSISCKFKTFSLTQGTIMTNINSSADRLCIQTAANKTIRAGIYNGTTYFTTKSSSEYELDVWHDMVFTFDGSTTSNLYIDGKLDNASTNSPSSGGVLGLVFGARTDADHFYNGSIQNMRIYNRELTAGEASKIARLKL